MLRFDAPLHPARRRPRSLRPRASYFPGRNIRTVSRFREERIAKNESIFRIGNERMADWEERHRGGERERYLCECADRECREKVELTHSQYEYVRSNSRWFVVIPGHEVPDVEKVIDRHDGWFLIQKDAKVSDIVEATDPRNPGDDPAGPSAA